MDMPERPTAPNDAPAAPPTGTQPPTPPAAAPIPETAVPEPPAHDTPVAAPPTPETLNRETPVPEVPAHEPPDHKTLAHEPPIRETPVSEPPAHEPPASATPTHEPSGHELPGSEAPIPAAPVPAAPVPAAFGQESPLAPAAFDGTPPPGFPEPHLTQPPTNHPNPTQQSPTGYPDQQVAVIPVVPYAPSAQPPFAYAPPPPPKPAGPPKSVAGAALLNLTGLGLGYAYLRNRALLVIALVGTAALITIGFATDAATQPWVWRSVALGWVAVLSAHAAFLASRRAPGAAQRKPVLTGIAAVAVVIAGYVGYGIAGASTYDSGITAQANGDCTTAIDEFDTVTGLYELTLSTDVLDAQDRTEECAAYDKALTAQKRKDYRTAITLYNDFGKVYPNSVLSKHVHKNLADAHFAQATSWKSPITPTDAEVSVNTLLMLRREFDDTDAAKKAPKAIADVFAEATKPYAEGKFCDSLTVLAYFAELDPSSAGEKVVADANTYRAKSLYECGLSQYRQNLYRQAEDTLGIFLAKYPQDAGVPQAKSALIAAKVSGEANVQIPLPPPLGGNDPGSIPVIFYNDSNTPVTILVAGPTAHEISIPACPACPASYPKDDPAACNDLTGRPSVTLHLPPNTYYYTTDDPNKINQATSSVTPQPGYEHWQCVYTADY
jgi:TolA-binding protein